MERSPIPVSCTLEPSALPERLASWRALQGELRSSRSGDGRLEAEFAESAGPELQRLVAAERSCCAWADWSVDGTTLVVRGPVEGVAALAVALLGPAG